MLKLNFSEYQIKLAKRIFWMAYQTSTVVGMGRFQARNGVTEDDVWSNVVASGDYSISHNSSDCLYADYVFGRMMKLRVKHTSMGLAILPEKFHQDYQSFSKTYSDPQTLMKLAVESLDSDEGNKND
ncbi:hypothetical protein C4561_01350 [candidate division WWE3 bacterium]|uniref:Uncharacterized protein n=1 Tax=candidate division WWE3 bacterium TaxID=2053526 RepID=A0A3A4ZFC7_UNCKA|nr:MAG: hypothetical protein C4561_01350 [candidate division WWE3 bacterium]